MKGTNSAPTCGSPATVAEPTATANVLAMEELGCGIHIMDGEG